MPKTVEIPIPIRIDKLTEVMRIKGVSVYVRWSVLLVAMLILLNVIHHPLALLLGLTAYLAVLLIHESGHLIAAQKLHCEVFSIELYPVFAITKFQTPWSRFDHCVIAWGGVIAQTIVALPIVGWLMFLGYSGFEPLNAVLVLLSFFSLAVAAINLFPIPPLDGAIAWAIFPEFFKRMRDGRNSRSARRY